MWLCVSSRLLITCLLDSNLLVHAYNSRVCLSHIRLLHALFHQYPFALLVAANHLGVVSYECLTQPVYMIFI